MPWFWYVTRDDELMLDIDGTVAGSALGPTRIRLEAAIDSGKLAVSAAWIYRSGTNGHFHVILKMAREMPSIHRYVWEMQLRGDLYRGRCNIMRWVEYVPAPSLLISPRPWRSFPREPDAACECNGKHTFEAMGKCPAHLQLRGPDGNISPFGALRSRRHVSPLKGTDGPISVAVFAHSEPDLDKPGDY